MSGNDVTQLKLFTDTDQGLTAGEYYAKIIIDRIQKAIDSKRQNNYKIIKIPSIKEFTLKINQ